MQNELSLVTSQFISKIKFHTFSLLDRSVMITTYLLKLVDLSDEEVPVPSSHFSISNMDHVLWEH